MSEGNVDNKNMYEKVTILLIIITFNFKNSYFSSLLIGMKCRNDEPLTKL